MKKKVVIIGAGPAGLTAAYELLKKSKNYKVTILEESNIIGGISKTINYKGNRMDIGGHRFFSKNDQVNEFWQEIMPIQGQPSYDDLQLNRNKNLPKYGPNPEKEDNVLLIRNRVSRIYHSHKFFDYPVSMKWQTIKNLGFIKTIQSGLSYLKSVLIKKKEDSLENFYINRFGRKLYSLFFEKYTEKLWGRPPKEISADWGAQRAKGLSIIALIKDAFRKIFNKKSTTKETSLIEEFIYPKYGPGALWEKVAFEIEKMGGKILLNHSVKKISSKKNIIQSVTCVSEEKNKEFKADIFISSMPIKDLINDMNRVPKNIKEISNGLPYRDFVTIGLLTKKLKLKNETDIKTLNNIIPDCWIYVQEPNVKLGRIQVFNNWSPYMVENPDSTIWLGLEYFCNENDEFWNMSEKDCINFAIEELVHMGVLDKEDVIDAHREKIKKAYPAYFDTYKDFDKIINYLNKYDNLYCVGRNGQHRYNNMDHSMITSFETVDNILNNIKTKDNIWNVNTEKEYHEEKKESNKETIFSKIKNKLKQIKINKWFLLMLMFAIPTIWWCTSNWIMDNDSWFLLKHGEYVLKYGFPKTEPFSMHQGFNFVMQQWLFAVSQYLLYLKTGEIGIFISLIIINFIIMFVFYKLCMLVSEKNYIISYICTLIIDMILLNCIFITTRPQIITYILMLLFIYIIEKYFKTGKTKLLIFLPIISLIQINTHASMWWFLYIFTLPYLAEGIYEKFILKKKNIYDYRYLIIIILICLLVGIINPYGIEAIYYFINSYSGNMGEIILEMKPIRILSFFGIFTIGIMFISFILYLIHYEKKKELKISYLLMLFGCTILVFMARKSFAYLCFFTIYPLSYYLKNLFRENCLEKPTIIPKKIKFKLIMIITLTITVIFCIISANNLLNSHEDYYAKKGVDKLLEEFKIEDITIYSNYDIGSYLEYRDIKAYIDARAEVFYITMNRKYDIFAEYYTLQFLNGDIDKFLEKYNFTHLFVLNYDRLYSKKDIENYEIFYEEENSYRIYVRKDLVKND